MPNLGAKHYNIGKRLAERRNIVLSSIKGASSKVEKNTKGALVSEIKKFIAAQNPAFKISVETLRETIEDLEIEGLVCQADNNKVAFKRYMLTED